MNKKNLDKILEEAFENECKIIIKEHLPLYVEDNIKTLEWLNAQKNNEHTLKLKSVDLSCVTLFVRKINGFYKILVKTMFLDRKGTLQVYYEKFLSDKSSLADFTSEERRLIEHGAITFLQKQETEATQI